ncbi:NAD(P)-dependent oxidoreductase [Clostridium botulinum]|uniref:precorrin-2 dehydrogenase n=1 Tax=Clostridium botulinum TaxID=1491 RepID=A0A6B4K250_CLOBO|nr:NAD(P)-dependent oxidoreductase [Clostridium botulinum]NFD82998.1 NAD(P)-dependent oxidoreductase [Clostridium botulinum]NFE07503.1 NAD(P)-dependent oxidoreductase [Clostridium botulinum]NFE35686.1 NAD(P)-dependent oxidoreductase [Clostridium botulinum]NFE48776.1 NAD(P)-dependent oxidoreductase [Clostridium botulinum]
MEWINLQGKYNFIALKSKRIRILIVGGGRAAFIKGKAFLDRGCSLYILAPKFSKNVLNLKNYDNVEFIKNNYDEKYILDKHLVVIATEDEEVNNEIRNNCDSLSKLYIDCSDKDKSLCFNSFQRESKTMVLALNNKIGCPKATSFIGEKIKRDLEKYDNYIEYVTYIRSITKNNSMRDEIIDFICSNDFHFFFEKGYGNLILSMFYGGMDFEFYNSYKKK